MQDYIEVTPSQFKLGLATLVIVVVLVIMGGLILVKKSQQAAFNAAPQLTANGLLPTPTPTAIAQVQDVSGALIESFPTFPVYPGAQIKSSRKQPNAVVSVNGYSAEWQVTGNKDVSTVANWYRTALAQQGWTVAKIDPENISVSEQDLRASRSKQNAAIIIEKGEETDAGTISILVDLPADAP